MSYSHAADGRLAPALQDALQRFAKPWYRLRALRIFRDSATLTVTAALWPDIQQALDDSEHLILMASPEAATSPWVRKEVQHWLASKPVERIAIVLTEGELRWDEERGGFDAARSDALPPSLARAFPYEPLWVDLRWVHAEEHLSPRRPEFRLAVARLAARLHGKPLDEIYGDDLRLHRAAWRTAIAAVISLVLLAAAAVTAAGIASSNARRATAARFTSVAQALASRATKEAQEGQHERAALFVRQAFLLHRASGGSRLAQIDGALREVLDTLPFAVELQIAGVELNATAASQNGRWVASAGTGREVFVWDLHRQGGAPARLPNPSGNVLALEFDRGATALVAITDADEIVTWELVSSSAAPRVERLSGVTGDLTKAALGPEGTRCAGASGDGLVRVWEVRRPSESPLVLETRSSRGRVTALALGPGDDAVAVGTSSGDVELWKLDRPEGRSGLLPGVAEPIASLTFSADGEWLGAGTSRGMPDMLERVGRGEDLFVARPVGGSVLVWSLTDPAAAPRRLGVHHDSVTAVAFSPSDGRLASAGGGDRTVRLWNPASGKALGGALHGHRGTVKAVRFTGDGVRLVSIDGGDREAEARSAVRLWRLLPIPHAPVRWNEGGAPVLSVAFDPRGEEIASAAGVLDVRPVRRGGHHQRRLDPGAPAVSVAFSPDGTLLAAGSESQLGDPPDFGLRLWDRAHLDESPRVLSGHTSAVEFVSFSADSRWAASAGVLDRRIRLWELAGTRDAEEVDAGAADVTGLAFFPSGARFLWSTGAGQVWSREATGGVPELLLQLPGRISALALARDGRTLSLGDPDGGVTVWDLEQRFGGGPRRLVGHAGTVRALAFDPHATGAPTLASGGDDRKVRIWDLARPEAEPVLLVASASVYALAYAPSGGLLAAGTADSGVTVWATTAWLADDVCHLVWRNLTEEEWKTWIGADVDRAPTCEDLPLRPDPPVATTAHPQRR